MAAKNRDFPGDDAELYAAGMYATVIALSQTAGHETGTHEVMRALTILLARHWLGWPQPR